MSAPGGPPPNMTPQQQQMYAQQQQQQILRQQQMRQQQMQQQQQSNKTEKMGKIQIQYQQRAAGLLEYQEKTERLLKRFFEEANIPETVVNLNCFQELANHLNPMVLIPVVLEYDDAGNSSADSIDGNKMKISYSNPSEERSSPELTLEDLANPHPSQFNREVSCIICGSSVETHRSALLNVNDSVKALMAAVVYGSMTLEAAEKAVCSQPLRMCKHHTGFVYDMMCKAIGAQTAEEVDTAPLDKLTNSLDIYKRLKGIRDVKDGRVAVNTPMGPYKMSIKSFFKKHVTVKMKARIARENYRKEQSYIKSAPPALSLQDFLNDETLICSTPPRLPHPGGRLNLVDFVRTTETQPSTSTGSANYGNSLMSPDLHHYDQQVANRRFEMTHAKQRKLEDEMNELCPPIQRRPPVDLNKIVQQVHRHTKARQIVDDNIIQFLTKGQSEYIQNPPLELMEPKEEPMNDYIEEVVEDQREDVMTNFGLDNLVEEETSSNDLEETIVPAQEKKT